MSKQTAVEWYRNTFFKALQEGLTISEGEIIFEQAIAMEKEQIMNAYLEGESDADHYDDSALRFYNETYGGDK